MRPWVLVGVAEALISLANQVQILPDNLISIFLQLPLVAVIIWLQLQNQKWLEHMLAVQRESLQAIYVGQAESFKEIYVGQSKLFERLIDRLSHRQDELVRLLGGLVDEISEMENTINKNVTAKDVVDQLLDRLPQPRNEKHDSD